jgi:hypothetical protein
MGEILYEGGDLSGEQHSPESEGYYRLSEVADFMSIAETLESIERGDLLTKQEVHHAIDLCSKTDTEVVRQNLEKRLAWMKKSGQFAVERIAESNDQV